MTLFSKYLSFNNYEISYFEGYETLFKYIKTSDFL